MSGCISGEGEEAVDFGHRLGRQPTGCLLIVDLVQIDRQVWIACCSQRIAMADLYRNFYRTLARGRYNRPKPAAEPAQGCR